MTQTEQDRIAAETMAWVRDIDRQLRQQAARIDERNGRMAVQQTRHNQAKKAQNERGNPT